MRGDYYRVAAHMRQRRNDLRKMWDNMFAAIPEAEAMFGNQSDYFDKLDAALKRVQHTEFLATQAEANELVSLAGGDDIMARCFHVTIRPMPSVVDFDAFRVLVDKYAKSKTFITACWTFEQKGTCDDTLGTGFHAHMVVRLAPGRTKTHGLQTASKLLTMCGNAGLQFDKAPRPWSIIDSYWLKYESRDGHKAATQSWDAKWRAKIGLNAIYGDADAFKPIPLPSPGGDGSSTHTVHFD